MHLRTLTFAFTIVVCGLAASAKAQSRPDESTIRAGHSIAVTTCISCHIVSPDQSITPVLGPGIPSFAEIANRPDATADTLAAAMKVARWHDPAMSPNLLPMGRISDRQRTQVAAYILSLRSNR
jgi:mono/diheme cytochrome c family protein